MSSNPNQPRKRRRLNTQASYIGDPHRDYSSSDDDNFQFCQRITRSGNRRAASTSACTNASKSIRKQKQTAESAVLDATTLTTSRSRSAAPTSTFTNASKLLLIQNHIKKDEDKKFEPSAPSTSGSTSKRSKRSSSLNSSQEWKTDNRAGRSSEKCVELKEEAPKSAEKKDTTKFVHKINNKFDAAGCNKILDYFKPVPTTSSCTKSREVEIPGPSIESKRAKSKEHSPAKNEIFFQKYRNTYGLLGESTGEDNDMICYFDRLPCHILEMIFCQMPIIDMMNFRLVCSTWDYVIKDENYMEWKKRYYSLKNGEPSALEYLNAICSFYNVKTTPENCFKVLIKYLSEKYVKKPSSDMCDLLSTNPKAIDAELVLAERFPEVLEKDSKAWCILATGTLLSETTFDVYELYLSVCKPLTKCYLPDVMDTIYCIASFLLHFRNLININNGLHYRAYCALYWIENQLPSKCDNNDVAKLKVPVGLAGQQSIHTYCGSSNSNLTFEQIRILNHHFEPKQILKVVALAGTGKTTTLVHLTQMYPQVKFLNIMYNKAVCEDAKKRFPPNVTCKTAHSLAYGVYGVQMRHKLVTKMRPVDMLLLMQHNSGIKLQVHSYTKCVISTIEKFVQSSDREICLEHVPSTMNDSQVTRGDQNKILKDALQIWAKMTDREERTVKITHDVYLKVYQLSEPRLTDYQCILVDEAQDCNPAMLAIVMSQKVPVILVGDPHQQIYAFRGARNALESIDATHVYYLTKSFRFGPEIAYIASCLLDLLIGKTKKTLVGSQKSSYVDGSSSGQLAIIARSNVQLFNEAIRLCYYNRTKACEPRVVLGAFVGGIRGYNFDQMEDMCKLQNAGDGPVPYLNDKFIAKFKTFKELANYARSVEDSDLLSKLELVNQHGNNIPKFLKAIKEKCNHSLALANVVFSTAHKAKGLEFETVCLTDDYPINPHLEIQRRGPISHLRNSTSEINSLDSEEGNVLYVALTRAKKCLIIPDKLVRALLACQEKFEYPKRSQTLMEVAGGQLKCCNCTDEFAPHTVLCLVRRKMMTANGRSLEGGPLCMKCATKPTVRPRVQLDPVIMYLDPSPDYAHRSMAAFVGPLPTDPPIVHETDRFMEMEIVYVINLDL